MTTMVYNSDTFVVVELDVPAHDTVEGEAHLSRGGYEIVDKFARKEIYLEGALAQRFRDSAAAAGVNAPIVPGIMPVSNFQGITKMAGLCGAKVPTWLASLFDGLDADPQTTHLVAAATAAEQVMDLVDQGIRQFHFYTLNRADLVYAICHLLGLRALASNGPALAKEAINA